MVDTKNAFGLRGRREKRVKDDDGVEFISFPEGPTKTSQGGLQMKPPLTTSKMFATGEKRCPVVLFKEYLEK